MIDTQRKTNFSLAIDAPQGLSMEQERIAVEVNDLNLYYGDKRALNSVSMQIPRNRVTAFIGPSGCGKSTLLRCFNRMNDLVDSCNIEGQVTLDKNNIYAKGVDVADLRRRVGMVFQKPNPFPKSIFENVAYGLRIQGIKKSSLSMTQSSGRLNQRLYGMRSKIACMKVL